jgi:RNA polymerase primary sigma factor
MISPTGIYFEEVHQQGDPPDVEEERELFRRIADGDQDALDAVVERNQLLVISIAQSKLRPGLELELSDLVQEGNIGLLRAVRKFDPQRGFRFSTYATRWIEDFVTQYVIRQSRRLKLPREQHYALLRYRRAQDELADELSRMPTTAELAERLELSVTAVRKLAELDNEPKFVPIGTGSVYSPNGPSMDSPNWTFGTDELVADHDATDPEAYAVCKATLAQVLAHLSALSERQQTVIRLRYGEGLSYAEIGERLGKARNTIRNDHDDAIARLRRLVRDGEARLDAAREVA